MSIDLIFILILVGLGSGLLAGLLGVGGGLLLVPALEFALKARGIEGNELVRYTLANSFFAIIFGGLAASWKQHKKGNFFLKPILTTSVGAIASGLLVAALITHFEWYEKSMFNLVFMALLIYVLYRMLKGVRQKEHVVKQSGSGALLLSGGITGVVSALSGLGGGMAMIPLFTEYIGMPIKMATSVSIGVIPLLVLPVSVQYALASPEQLTGLYQWGYLVFPLSIPLVAGILVTAPLGVNLASRVSGKTIRLIFSTLILVIVLRYLFDTLFYI